MRPRASGGSHGSGCGLVAAHRGAERHRQAIPGVDRDNSERQVDEFLLGELGLRFAVKGVAHAAASDLGHRFGPCKGCTFPGAEERWVKALHALEQYLRTSG